VSASKASTFDLLPAIDLREGQVVRLRQGDFARLDVFGDDPAAVALGFAEAGARWIHVVDLDGSLAGERRQARRLADIVAALEQLPNPPALQVAGGLRTAAAIDAVLTMGAARVVIGTAALRDPAFVAAAIERHGPERIAVALDVRDGQAVGQGWVPGASGLPIATALDRLTAVGVATFAVTAIDRDGELGGPDLALLEAVILRTRSAVLASGGISTPTDLDAVRAIGCAGAIVGRALYEGRMTIQDALAASGVIA
jgi:phosphoribosylformimino-5-aminoimidazole carboxamide ribotide isomerase